MRFENRIDMAKWLHELFIQQAPIPKQPLKEDGSWNVQAGDMHLLLKKDSNSFYFSYVKEMNEGNQSFVEWYRGVGPLMKLIENKRGWELEDLWYETLDENSSMNCSTLFRSYYVFPFDKITLSFFLNWEGNPLEVKE